MEDKNRTNANTNKSYWGNIEVYLLQDLKVPGSNLDKDKKYKFNGERVEWDH